ncbi:WD40 repeat-like protein [Patellaria atrata CBS 101060]|uniref:WD40 repeat-like protein n=1 Tax=Patellaria atrata CBS 101060 TaxID=1346257 RepID=A0A9P4S3K3_9PEZI|nr:WD40 repeat-like protein [Patellaria atrata CBS 101060]
MVRSYIKYEHSQTLGIVTSATSNVVWIADARTDALNRATGAGRAYVGANEEVLSWDVKKGELLSRWRDSTCNSEVTVLANSKADPDVFAVGYADGSIRVWDSRIATIIVTFNGHKSAVTTLSFDKSGVRLASGSKDTDIIIWDLVAEIGLFKLRGHKDQVTAVHLVSPPSPVFNEEESLKESDSVDLVDSDQCFLLSCSKDSLIKLWNINTQHCIETHVGQSNGECWAMGLSPECDGCITAGNDGELRVWAIDINGLRRSKRIGNDPERTHYLHDRGVLYRQAKDRTIDIKFHPNGSYIAAHGSEKAVELWRIRNEAEVVKALARKRKRRREKEAATEKTGDTEMTDRRENVDDISLAEVTDIFVPHVIVRTGGKVKSADWSPTTSKKTLQLLLGTTNNLLEVYHIPMKDKSKKSEDAADYNRAFSVEIPGHRSDIRAVALSSDDRMLATASSGALKVWNVRTQSCLRTIECGYALCCAFLPGDKIVVVGTKSGELELFDIASSELIDRVAAHEGSIWTLQVHPNGRSVITGSADKSAKFWNFQIVQEEIPGTKRTFSRLKLVHARTLKVNDDILSICISPDSRLLAVSTLDNTVKVFFLDSLKFFLNLYGHKLPVLNMSISSDSKLIATCSADKNIRLWGLDFGDCHKAFFGHNDSIMQVAFIPHPVSKEDVHTFFSASKDRIIKTWDGDKFEQVQKIEGHFGEIWAMTVSKAGDFFITASHDKSIRVWSQSDEPIFLEEERERELEELYESTLTTNLEADAEDEEGEGEAGEVAAATKQTIATLTAGERIMEALEVGYADLELVRVWEEQKRVNPNIAPPQRDPLFLALSNISAERHVLNTVAKLPASQLHDALLVLPFSVLPQFFAFIRIWVVRQWNIPLTCRVLFFMLKTHQRQIVASRELMVPLEEIRKGLRKTLSETKDVLGFNLAALGFVSEQVSQGKVTTLEAYDELQKRTGKRKRAFAHVA